MLDPLAVLSVEQPLRPCQPAAGTTNLAPAGEVGADPERAAHGGQRLAGVQVGAVRPLQEPEVVVLPAEHVGAGGQQLQVLGAEGIRAVCGRQRVVGVGPRLASVGLTTPVESGDSGHAPDYRRWLCVRYSRTSATIAANSAAR